jgi:hypothetical protein
VEGRDTWKALQAKLALARERLNAKDHAAALEAVQAALAIDPDFLAAHSLRQRIELDRLPDPLAAREPQASTPPTDVLPASPPASTSDNTPLSGAVAVAPAAGRRFGAILADVYAQHRVDPARPVEQISEAAPKNTIDHQSIPLDHQLTPPTDQEPVPNGAQGSIPTSDHAFVSSNDQGFLSTNDQHRGFAASDDLFRTSEVPQHADLGELRLNGDTDLDDFAQDSNGDGHASRSTGIIQVTLSAAVLIAVILVDQPDRYPRLIADYFNLPKPTEVAPLLNAAPLYADMGDLIGGGRSANFERPVVVTPPDKGTFVAPAMRTVREGPTARVTEPVPTTMIVATADGPVEVPAPPPPEPTPAPRFTPPPPAAVSASAIVGDEQGVKDALQRYRSAYDRLDARLAHSVWPSVNEAALARAFDSLQSQSLTFTACDVAFDGPAAVATCEGTMRYTPRVGSRDAKVEPHVWTFTLRKRGPDWQINSVKGAR